MSGVLILRPQPGADASAARARAIGLTPIVASLFSVRPVAWTTPDPANFDAVMMTSANAARHAGPQLNAFVHLPCFAVGEATATAARDVGFGDVRTGPADAAALAEAMRDAGVRRAFHPTGADHAPTSGVMTSDVVVYASEATDALPLAAAHAISAGALVLLHSPRSAATLARLWQGERDGIALAAISEAAAHAAGPGWKSVDWPDRPRDEALLELAARLCKTAPSRGA